MLLLASRAQNNSHNTSEELCVKKYIKVTVYGAFEGKAFLSFIQAAAASNKIEGSVQQQSDGSIVMHARGTADALDILMDEVYAGPEGACVEEVGIQLSSTQRDFRGVFRVIQ